MKTRAVLCWLLLLSKIVTAQHHWLVDNLYVIPIYHGMDTIHLPTVILANKSAEQKINQYLSVDTLIGETLTELLHQGVEDSDRIVPHCTDISFEEYYSENGLLSLSIYTEGMGAHPSSETCYFVFDTTTGNKVPLTQLLEPTKIKQLVRMCEDTLQQKIRNQIADVKLNQPEELDALMSYVENDHFKEENLNNYSIISIGVHIYYPFEFAHCCRALEPDGEIILDSKALKPFLKPQYKKLFIN